MKINGYPLHFIKKFPYINYPLVLLKNVELSSSTIFQKSQPSYTECKDSHYGVHVCVYVCVCVCVCVEGGSVFGTNRDEKLYYFLVQKQVYSRQYIGGKMSLVFSQLVQKSHKNCWACIKIENIYLFIGNEYAIF